MLCAACSAGSREATLIENFFAAARLQDTAALSSLARASFNPRVDGTVRQFHITKIAQTSIDGETVTIDAQVLMPSGATAEQTLQVVLDRPSPDGSWMIVAVQRTARPAS